MPADRRRPDVDVAHCASQAGLAAALPPHHAVEPPVNAQPGATVSLAVVSRAASRTETTVEWMTCILTDPRFMHCAARFRGTRIPVSVVLDNLADGLMPEQILQQYPSLKPEHIAAALAYAADLARERIVRMPA